MADGPVQPHTDSDVRWRKTKDDQVIRVAQLRQVHDEAEVNGWLTERLLIAEAPGLSLTELKAAQLQQLEASVSPKARMVARRQQQRQAAAARLRAAVVLAARWERAAAAEADRPPVAAEEESWLEGILRQARERQRSDKCVVWQARKKARRVSAWRQARARRHHQRYQHKIDHTILDAAIAENQKRATHDEATHRMPELQDRLAAAEMALCAAEEAATAVELWCSAQQVATAVMAAGQSEALAAAGATLGEAIATATTAEGEVQAAIAMGRKVIFLQIAPFL